MVSDNCIILNHSECSEYVERHGDSRTVTTFRKYQLDADIRIEFCWGNAESYKDRARCIRGAFRRIKKDRSEQGKCSNHFKGATYRVV